MSDKEMALRYLIMRRFGNGGITDPVKHEQWIRNMLRNDEVMTRVMKDYREVVQDDTQIPR